MKRIFSSMSPPAASMRWRLIIALGCILLTCQLSSVAWLWHESKEQIEFLVDKTLSEHACNEHVAKEIRASSLTQHTQSGNGAGFPVSFYSGSELDNAAIVAPRRKIRQPQCGKPGTNRRLSAGGRDGQSAQPSY